MSAPEKQSLEVVELHVITVSFDCKHIIHRTHKYEKKKVTLNALPENDKQDAPIGLRRLRLDEVPCVGGLNGRAAIGYTVESARKALMQSLLAERARHEDSLWGINSAIALLHDEENQS